MSCLCPPKAPSAELPDVEEVEEVIPEDLFSKEESMAKDISALCQKVSNQTMTATSLGNRTITVDSNAPGNCYPQWKETEILPYKKHFALPSTAGGTRAGMAAISADWDPVDHLVLGNLASNKDPPKSKYFPGQLHMMPCSSNSSADAVVYTMSGKNKKLSDGKLKLPTDTFLVLDATCSGVELKNLVIEGGYVVCHGKGCKVTFTNVKFKNCCLVILAKAKCTLNDVTFDNEKFHLLSIAVKDSGSKVVMREGVITGGENGIFLSEGSCLEASGVTVEKILSIAVKSTGKKSSVMLTDCTFKNFLSIKKLYPMLDAYTEAISLRFQSTGTFQKVKIEGADVGMYLHHSTAVLSECTVSDCLEKGVDVRGGAKVTAVGSTFSRTGPGPGVGVSSGVVAYDSGTSVSVEKCTFEENNESAVSVIGGAVVVVADCQAVGNKGINARARRSTERKPAFCIVGSGRMTVRNTSVVGETGACGGGKITMEGVKVNGRSVTK